MGTALQVGLLLAKILNWLFARMDKAEQAKLLAALFEKDLAAADQATIKDAQTFGAALVEHFKAHPELITAPDQDMVQP